MSETDIDGLHFVIWNYDPLHIINQENKMAESDQMLKLMNDKIDGICRAVEKNTDAISKLQSQISYGRGAIYSFAFLGLIIGAIVGIMKIID